MQCCHVQDHLWTDCVRRGKEKNGKTGTSENMQSSTSWLALTEFFDYVTCRQNYRNYLKACWQNVSSSDVDGHHMKCAPLSSTPLLQFMVSKVMAFRIKRLDGWEYNSMQKKMLFGRNSVKFDKRTGTSAVPIRIHWRTDFWSVR